MARGGAVARVGYELRIANDELRMARRELFPQTGAGGVGAICGGSAVENDPWP
jgi:hypothetical protein